MRFDLITIFPEFFAGPLDHGIVRRARETELIHLHVQDLREFTKDRHRTVDDRPFGGGEGMVLKPGAVVLKQSSHYSAGPLVMPRRPLRRIRTRPSSSRQPRESHLPRRQPGVTPHSIASSLSVGVTKEWTSGWHSIWQLKKYRLATSS